MDRRKFLRMGVAGLAGASLMSAVNVSRVFAQEVDAALEEEFRAAAARFRVPQEVIKSMGFVNTRWEMPPPETTPYRKGDLHGYGTYGIMALTQNPWDNTLGEASRLTGIPVERLKTDRAANILGGAALLAESQGRRPGRLGDWFGAVSGRGGNGKRYEAVAGVGGGKLYAEQVFDVLRRGAEARVRSGKVIRLRPLRLELPLRDGWEVRR
jgi:hypothetical protein